MNRLWSTLVYASWSRLRHVPRSRAHIQSVLKSVAHGLTIALKHESGKRSRGGPAMASALLGHGLATTIYPQAVFAIRDPCCDSGLLVCTSPVEFVQCVAVSATSYDARRRGRRPPKSTGQNCFLSRHCDPWRVLVNHQRSRSS